MNISFKIDIEKYIIVGSCLYLAIAPIGIAHICFIVGLLVLFHRCLKRPCDSSILWLVALIVFSCIQLSIPANWKPLINNVSSMLMYIIIVVLLKGSTYNRLLHISYVFIKATTYALVTECVIRLSLSIPHGFGLYNLKGNSFMFLDTNFCGLMVLVLVCYVRYLIVFCNQVHLKKFVYIYVLLLLLTFSRAAIIGYIFFEFLFFNMTPTRWKLILFKRLAIIIIWGTLIGGIIIDVANNDDSFKSKIYIYNIVIENIDILRDKIVWGVGYEHGQTLLGIYPHNFFLLYLLETGIIGLVFKLIFILYILHRTRWIGLFIAFAYLVPIQSAASYATHYFYVVLALMTLIDNYHSYQDKIQKKDEKGIGLYRNS